MSRSQFPRLLGFDFDYIAAWPHIVVEVVVHSHDLILPKNFMSSSAFWCILSRTLAFYTIEDSMSRRKYNSPEEAAAGKKEARKLWIEKNREKYLEMKRKSSRKNQAAASARRKKYYHTKGKQIITETNRRYQRNILQKYREFMSNKVCNRCQYNNPEALVWHHIDKSTKIASVYNMVNRGFNWDKILLEISKCECLCQNCHAIEHYCDTTHRKQRQKYKDFMKTQQCKRCGAKTPGTLSWHHIDPKTKSAEVSALVTANSSWKKIIEEISKCECLCRTCHHIDRHYFNDNTHLSSSE
jgi:hypothetical protein